MLVQACLWARNSLRRRFYGSQGAMRHAQVCLCDSTDQESIFHHCVGPVKLVQPCLCEECILQRRFNRRGGAVKHVQSCLSASKNEESSFTTVEVL